MITRNRRAYSHHPLLAVLFSLICSLALAQAAAPAQVSTPAGLNPIRTYIANGWDVLTRSMTRCDSIVDPKVATKAVLYLPADFPAPPAVQKLQNDCKVEVQHLPPIHQPGQTDVRSINPPGLLYLPNAYVVPGGRFNEMYGWDSYFIIVGLIRDGRLDLAKGMVENFFFEVEHYGTFLNANRTYYLTRSQPPYLSSMIMEVYQAEKAAGHSDRGWLQRAYDHAAKDYQLWVHEPHLAGSTGLSRYFDFGDGPVAEGLQDETGYYKNVAAFFLTHPDRADHDLVETEAGKSNPDAVGFGFELQLCETTQNGKKCEPFRTVSLSHDYYKGDRSMRESGFDVAFRFGPFGAQTHHYAAVCLNSLLYKTETDLATMSDTLGKKEDAARWRKLAEDRKARMNQLFWNSGKGMFFDYEFETQKQSSYTYVTTFYPMWAGLASPDQARAIEKNLQIFEQPGGLDMSPTESGGQWDHPYGWAPMQLVGIEGLRRYGFNDDANRVAYKFLSTVAENFRHDGTIREKYNVVTRSSETTVTAGYHMNIVGFGWTNGVFLELLQKLPSDAVERLAREQTNTVPASK
ncbi:MAG: trehalase family glycosidase [Acidobacteriota bacterium]